MALMMEVSDVYGAHDVLHVHDDLKTVISVIFLYTMSLMPEKLRLARRMTQKRIVSLTSFLQSVKPFCQARTQDKKIWSTSRGEGVWLSEENTTLCELLRRMTLIPRLCVRFHRFGV
jgi:hypothetical protein